MGARGPKPLPPEQRKENQRQNVSLDPDAVAALNAFRQQLADELGFTPTLSQTLKLLVKRAGLLK